MKTHDAILHMKIPTATKARWDKAAKKAKISLSAYVRTTVDAAQAAR